MCMETVLNIASTGQVGLVDIFEHFSGFKFILLTNIVHARPLAGNVNRWEAGMDTEKG